MSNYTLQDITELRDLTGMGLSDIKNALVEAEGDRSKAMALLKERGAKIMGKKADRTAGEGVIEAYVHAGRTGVILELNCETDFVARSDSFKEFAHDVALQIASMAPANVEALLEQSFVKDSKLTIGEYLRDTTGRMGEKIVISRFTRYALGENVEAGTEE
jgi:elongation factor Ts